MPRIAAAASGVGAVIQKKRGRSTNKSAHGTYGLVEAVVPRVGLPLTPTNREVNCAVESTAAAVALTWNYEIDSTLRLRIPATLLSYTIINTC